MIKVNCLAHHDSYLSMKSWPCRVCDGGEKAECMVVLLALWVEFGADFRYFLLVTIVIANELNNYSIRLKIDCFDWGADLKSG